jgi:hypothetical protein
VTEQHDEQAPYDDPGERPDEQAPEDQPDDQPDDLPVSRAEVTASDGADPRVAAAVARLDELGDTPPAEHVEVYEDVHRVLQDALADAARPQESAGHESAEHR